MKKYSQMTPEGTRDFLFEECDARRNVERALSKLFKSRGYNKVITPAIEFFDVFNRESAGMAPEMFYSLSDSQGRMLVLRPDSTLPIARIAATRLREAEYPLRLYYNQTVFRRNPRFSGMSDETSQAGIELIGAPGLRADMEVLLNAIDALGVCGTAGFKIEIGHAGFFSALASELNVSEELREEIVELIETKSYSALNDILDNLSNIEVAGLIKRLPRMFGGAEVLGEARRLCSEDSQAIEALEYLENVYSKIEESGLADKVSIDLGMVHRNNYYTGIVFRGYVEGSGKTALSGGRYDMLISEFGKDLPAIGFGIEVDALAETLLQRDEVKAARTADALVFATEGNEMKAMLRVRELNAEGLCCENCILQSEEEAKKYAEKKKIDMFEVI